MTTTNTHELGTQLITALPQLLSDTQTLIDDIAPEELADPSGCTGWSARQLLVHMNAVNTRFAAAIRGEDITKLPAEEQLAGDDVRAAHANSTRNAIDAWSRPGVAEQILIMHLGELPGAVAVRFHFVDNLLHRWDLGHPLGRDVALPDAQCELAMSATRTLAEEFGGDLPRGEQAPFADLVECPQDAPVWQRLLAFTGREFT